ERLPVILSNLSAKPGAGCDAVLGLYCFPCTILSAECRNFCSLRYTRTYIDDLRVALLQVLCNILPSIEILAAGFGDTGSAGGFTGHSIRNQVVYLPCVNKNLREIEFACD